MWEEGWNIRHEMAFILLVIPNSWRVFKTHVRCSPAVMAFRMELLQAT